MNLGTISLSAETWFAIGLQTIYSRPNTGFLPEHCGLRLEPFSHPTTACRQVLKVCSQEGAWVYDR